MNTNLDWSSVSPPADHYGVYFGTDPSPDEGEYQGTTYIGYWDLAELQDNTEYYWQIGAVNECGYGFSPVWSFATGSAPSVIQHPQGCTICEGESCQLCVTASGTPPLGYQWQRNGSDIPGATSSCYNATQAGSYRCRVSNSCGSVTSYSATVTVKSAPTAPTDATASPNPGCPGQTVTLTAIGGADVMVTPSRIDFGAVRPGDPVRALIQIHRNGLPFSFQVDLQTVPNWLTVDPDRGESNGAPLIIAVTAATGNLAAGVYAAVINVTVDDEVTKTIPVTLAVQEEMVDCGVGLCGAGALPILPLTLLGLACVKFGRRRAQPRDG